MQRVRRGRGGGRQNDVRCFFLFKLNAKDRRDAIDGEQAVYALHRLDTPLRRVNPKPKRVRPAVFRRLDHHRLAKLCVFAEQCSNLIIRNADVEPFKLHRNAMRTHA